MIVIVDNRELVTDAFRSGFAREGVSVAALNQTDAENWVSAASAADLQAVEGTLLGDVDCRCQLVPLFRKKTSAPVLAITDITSLDETLKLFACGIDDVVRKPVHIREIIARIGAIRRRTREDTDWIDLGKLRVFGDGRDPQIDGTPFILPRRERRILDYLVINRNRRVSRGQIFNAVYGLYDEEVEESVVESHISKLRKKLKGELGYDPIDTKRFLGYQLIAQAETQTSAGCEVLYETLAAA